IPNISATDNCDDDLEVIQDPPENTQITSDTLVTITATDDAGNKDSCTFMVIVEEKVEDSKPTFDCSGQGDIPNLELDANCNYEEPDYKNFLSNFENFKNEPFIVQTSSVEDKILKVKFQVFDSEGGEFAGECNLQFYLFDNTAPIFNCPSSTIEISPNHEGKYILPDFGYLAEDNCDNNLVITQNPLPGEITSNATVVIAASDSAGNTSNTCIFSVVLTADPQPTFQCPSADEIQLFLDD